jgi:hypothetical protein
MATRADIDSGAGEAVGVLLSVDILGREIRVAPEGGSDRGSDGGGDSSFDVPADCPIVLNGEAVKLRMLQAGDRVRVAFLRQGGRRVAGHIRAGSGRGGPMNGSV